MISDIVEEGIKNISDGKKLNILEILGISLYLGGEDIFKNNSRELYIKLNNSLEYSSYRSQQTILSNDNNGFVIGEIFPVEIREQTTKNVLIKGYAMINIEAICVPPTFQVEGDSPLEILSNFNDLSIIEIIKNSMTLEIVSKTIVAYNKNDLLKRLNDNIRVENTEFILMIDDKVFLFVSKNNNLEIIKIENLSEENGEITKVNDLSYLDKILEGR